MNKNPSFNRIWLCPSWLKSTCPRQLHHRINRIEKTAILDIFDSSQHERHKIEVKDRMEKLGYEVKTEVKLTYETEEFLLAHWFDLIGIRDGKTVVVEVKPMDRSCYDLQYALAQTILIHHPKVKEYEYYVSQYKLPRYEQKLINKQQPDVSEIERIIDSKLTEARKAEPLENPSNECNWCPYAQCTHHPQHESYQLSILNKEK